MPDFRLPQHRRRTFLKFYDFQIRYKAHPGCVYYIFPALAKINNWNMEDKLWFAYINGNTQNPVTSWLIYQRFPTPTSFMVNDGDKWFNQNWKNLQWDTDRRYQKKDFPSNVEWYSKIPDQESYFKQWENDPDFWFDDIWKVVRGTFPSFGRLASFSYIEYLWIMGLPIECSNLFFEDIEGSKSHRNGLAIVLGRDDLDWHNTPVKYSSEDITMFKEEGKKLLVEAKELIEDTDVSYFTLESALCTYKSWHRPNRRYPNVYNDMLYNRIKWAEEHWPLEELAIFWEIRKKALPWRLRKESNQLDPGLCKEKQNYYLQNGVPIMMSMDFPEFYNDFDRRIWSAQSLIV